ncbi:hypothetical protein Ddye_030692 [Dipteronia dyeriana]|uniref:Uncharacterized protein n=1 Tax=Dipteronia dyeriana TaxID=168575 RepID=A0AAD9TGV2_9ROSI|nr:hypothetical protein Ddye_030692 [Dipteronia dyeriana]
MANEGTQGKSKTVWDSQTHEIWVDLAIEQVGAENRNGTHLSKQGRNFLLKTLAMRQDWFVIAFGLVFGDFDCFMIEFDWAWALTSGVMPHMYTTSSGDNVDATNSLDSEEANHGEEVECRKRKEKTLQPNRKKFKKGKKKNNSTTSKLSKQLNELCESVKNRNSYIQTDTPGCSVQEVVEKSLLECEPMSPLFKLGISLFTKKANREISIALKELAYQIQWLKDQQY